MNDQPVTVEKTFVASISKVWKALTDKDEMKIWYFDISEFRTEVGFKFRFMGGEEDNLYLHLCEVTEVVPEKRIAYSWRYDGYPGNSVVTFELSDQGGNTALKLTHDGVETFPESNPDLARKNFVEGWTHLLNISLEEYLAADGN